MTVLNYSACYVRLYRDYLGRRVTLLGALRAVASCGSIAAWAVWKQYSFAWGAIIAASQLVDALKDVFPFSKNHKAASEYASALSSLFIDAQLEWDAICTHSYSDKEIMHRLHALRKLQFEAEKRSFPEGVATKINLQKRADQDAKRYLTSTYDVS